MSCTFERNTRPSRIAIVFIILNTEIKNKSKISNNRRKDVFSDKKKKADIFAKTLISTSCFNRKYNYRWPHPGLRFSRFLSQTTKYGAVKQQLIKWHYYFSLRILSVRIIIYERIGTVDKWIKVKVFVYFTHWSSSSIWLVLGLWSSIRD